MLESVPRFMDDMLEGFDTKLVNIDVTHSYNINNEQKDCAEVTLLNLA